MSRWAMNRNYTTLGAASTELTKDGGAGNRKPTTVSTIQLPPATTSRALNSRGNMPDR